MFKIELYRYPVNKEIVEFEGKIMTRAAICILFAFLSVAGFSQNTRTIFDDVEYKLGPSVMINTVASDISPVFVGDSLYFTSVDDKYFNKTKREKTNTDFYNIYSASVNSNGIITSRRRSIPDLNNEYHEGPADYCEATGELFITVSNVNEFDRVQKMVPVENIRLELVIMKKINGRWTITEKLPFNDNRYNFAQPAISISGDTLVFSSDLKPNYGKSDLFMSVRYNKVWSAPVNLGSEINTSGSELFPSFIPGNLLTFASNQQKDNKGGLDIYFSELPLLNKVFTLPAPINSAFDDFALKFHKSRDIAYFVSNRNRNSNDDIFRLDIQKLYRTFSGRIFDMNSNSPVINAAVIFSNCRGGTINTVLSDTSGYFSNDILSNECVEIEIVADGYQSKTANISNINSLDFRLISKQYYELLVVDAENNLPLDSVLITNQDNVNFYTNPQGLISIKPPLTDSRRLTVTRNGYLFQELTASPLGNSLVTKDTVYLVKKQPNTIIFRKSVLANSDELKILEESTSIYEEIIKILERSPDLKVEIGWHSDSRGSYNDNMRQTRNRSVFAVSYLERRGIDKSRIVGKGYGESQLLNRCRNGVNCTEEEHSVNRRIELKIIGFVEPDEKPAE